MIVICLLYFRECQSFDLIIMPLNELLVLALANDGSRIVLFDSILKNLTRNLLYRCFSSKVLCYNLSFYSLHLSPQSLSIYLRNPLQSAFVVSIFKGFPKDSNESTKDYHLTSLTFGLFATSSVKR